MLDTERPNQGVVETGSPKTFSLRDIARAITIAREEILDIPLQERVYTTVSGHAHTKIIETDESIYRKVSGAKEKAKKEGGSHWLQRKIKGVSGEEIDYDGDHVVGIFEALENLLAGKRKVDYRELGITVPVLRRAEEMLFGIPANQS